MADYLERLLSADLSPWIECADTALPQAPTVIGESREGRPLHAYSFGKGSSNVSVIAGCHADEPVGPITARLLAHAIDAFSPDLLDACTFHVITDMNPDGARRNRGWFERFPDIHAYVNGTVRERPGDDVELEVELIVPIAMEEGLRFAIREGGRTVGAGVVTKIFE